MDNAVALAAIGLASTTVIGFIWLVKFMAKTLGESLQNHTEAAIRQTEASEEVLTFMKNLNGKLARATIQKVKEQNVEHQTVYSRSDKSN